MNSKRQCDLFGHTASYIKLRYGACANLLSFYAGNRTLNYRDSPSARYGGKFALTGEACHLLRKTTNVAQVLHYPLLV